jgi:hypothetical protein
VTTELIEIVQYCTTSTVRAFRAFAHDFSEAMFVRDKDDEAQVRVVLERKGINWDYARRAHSPSLNRRIRRYIPPRDILVP